MALLTRLLGLHRGATPTEDFLTEVVAYLFEIEPQLCLAWLHTEGVIDTPEEDASVRVGTQLAFSARDGHDTGSRPDLAIWLEYSDTRDPDIIFVESKVGSTEGDKQLQRYAEHLAATGPATRRTLIYLTRDYEEKDERAILASVPKGVVRFESLRWHGFHRFLGHWETTHDTHAIITETLRFMEAQNMDQSNRFTPADALALGRFRQTISLMDEALRAGPADRFEKMLGGKSRDSASMTQLRDHNRYVIYKRYQTNSFEVHLGFKMLAGHDYPVAMLYLGCSPTDGSEKLLDAFYDMAKRDGWEIWDQRPKTNWTALVRPVPMETILGEENHVTALKTIFNSHLDALAEMMLLHGDLPWKAPAIEDA